MQMLSEEFGKIALFNLALNLFTYPYLVLNFCQFALLYSRNKDMTDRFFCGSNFRYPNLLSPSLGPFCKDPSSRFNGLSPNLTDTFDSGYIKRWTLRLSF